MMNLMIDDDAMCPLLNPQDVVEVIHTRTLEDMDGCIGVFVLDNIPCIRLLHEQEDGFIFTPINLEWHNPLFISKQERDRIKVCGRIEKLVEKKLYIDPETL